MKNFSGLTITGATSDGYSVKANGYVKGSWLQSSVMQNYGSNTGKVCVFDNSGWIYYRTPAEIVAEAGGGGSTDVVQTTGTSTTSVMSQKATTDELAKKANLNGGNTFSGAQTFKDFIEFVDSNGDGVLSLGNNAIFVDPEDRGLIPVSFSGSFGLSGQVLTSQGHNTTPIWEYVTKHGYTELTNENLDTITEAGWYRAASGNTCTNRPSRILSTDPFVLEVEKSTDVYTKQTLYMTGNSGVYTTAIYFRMKGSSWSAWQESALVYKGVDQTFSGRKTFSSGINLTNSLQVNGSSGTAGQVLTSTGSGTPEWKDISGSADAMPTIRLVSIKDTTGTGICGPNNPLRFSFVVEKGTLLDTDVIELCSRTLFTYKAGHYLNYWGDGGVQDFGRTYKLRAFHQIAVSNLTLDNGIYKFEIGGTNSNYALRQLVRSNRPGPSSKSPYTIIKYFRVMRRKSGQGVPKNIHSNVIPIHVAPTKPVLDASTNEWSVKIRIR